MKLLACPTEPELAAFTVGDLSIDRIEEVSDHLETCSDCMARIANVSRAPDLLTQAIRQASQVSPYAKESARTLPAVLRDYRLDDVLGEGGMGTVYRATHMRLGRPVALKLLTARRRLDPEAAARFEREMLAIGALRHPNIVQPTDAGEIDGVPFLAMELLEGRDLSRLVNERGPMKTADACEAIRQAALGLQHAHENGLVHRDVKPSNLMLTPDGTIKLLDLGLARTIESTEGDVVTDSTVAANADLTDTKTRLGTENYMAPEQSAAPDKVDARADVFALGRTLGFLLTGTPQLSATGVPGGLFKVLQRLQAERPEDRMPTASAIAQALEPWARDHALEAMLGGRRRRSRRRVGAWVSVLALVVAAVSIAIAVLNRRHEPEAATTPIDQTPQAPREPPLAGRLGMSSDEAKKLQSQWAEFLGQNEAVAKVVEMKLNLIPPGRILQRTIDIPITKPYWLGTTEVTRGQFRVFVNATGYKTDAERGSGGSYFVAIRASKGKGMSVAKKSANRGITWERPGYENPSDEDPVTQVSWNDAVAFCRWLSESDGNRYRLPTLAESEWAARAGNPLTSPRDPDDANRPFELEKVAWTYLNSPLRPQPVAKLSPNDWGLYDTVGNISEWCQDWLYDQLKKAPTGVIPDYAGPDNGMFRILFGCDYTHRLGNLKYRNNRPDSQGSDLGFRVLREH